MNVFKGLDSIFPCGSERSFGEVVSTNIRVIQVGVDLCEISSKRKAWNVNASVNAFHMHRHLVRDFMDNIHGSELSDRQIRTAKRFICLAVLSSYLENHENGQQVCSYILQIGSSPYGSVSLWRVTSTGVLCDVKDYPWLHLADIVEFLTSVGDTGTDNKQR